MDGSWVSELELRLERVVRSGCDVHAEDLLPLAGGLRKLVFRGPHGGGDRIRVGFFSGIHGDEPAGPCAVAELLQRLIDDPEAARGYELFCYPICNPGGCQAGTRESATGKDLNREFWKGSKELEVIALEREIRQNRFQGMISLHADDTCEGLYGYVRGAVLTRNLLEPALKEAESVIARDRRPLIDGFPAQDGIISECFDGILTSPPQLEPLPFELILETPQHAPLEEQVEALARAMERVLREYSKLLSYAADL